MKTGLYRLVLTGLLQKHIALKNAFRMSLRTYKLINV